MRRPPASEQTIQVLPLYQYGQPENPATCLFHLARELGRVGGHHLMPRLQEPLSEIQGWLDSPTSEGVRAIYDFSRLGFAEILKLSKDHLQHYGSFIKPRVAITMEITTKDNLSVRWRPHHVSLKHHDIPAPEWRIHPSTEPYIVHRPENELMFLRGIGLLQPEHLEDPNDRAIAMLLLLAAAGAVAEQIERLKHHFDVQTVTYFNLIRIEASEAGITAEAPDYPVPFGWEIRNAIDDLRDELQAFISAFADDHRVLLTDFWKICSEARYPEHNHLDRDKASKILRKMGGTDLTPAVVERLHQEVQIAIDAGLWQPA